MKEKSGGYIPTTSTSIFSIFRAGVRVKVKVMARVRARVRIIAKLCFLICSL
jgi:hypothetical protein